MQFDAERIAGVLTSESTPAASGAKENSAPQNPVEAVEAEQGPPSSAFASGGVLDGFDSGTGKRKPDTQRVLEERAMREGEKAFQQTKGSQAAKMKAKRQTIERILGGK